MLQRKGAGRPQISDEIESVRVAYTQGYHRTTPENKHAAVRLPKRQKLFIVKPQKVVEDQQNKGLHVHRVPFFR